MAAVLLLTASRTALACDCRDLSASESFREADVVFEGELISIKPAAASFPNDMAYIFRVSKVFKGSPAGELTLMEGLSNCDATFAPDTLYRVYARSFEGRLSSSSCFPNQVLGVTRVDTDLRQVMASPVYKLIPLAAIGLVAAIVWLLIRRRA